MGSAMLALLDIVGLVAELVAHWFRGPDPKRSDQNQDGQA